MTTDTPRTDAYGRHWPSETECVPSLVARQLERELYATRKLAIELVKELISKCDDPIHIEQLKELEK